MSIHHAVLSPSLASALSLMALSLLGSACGVEPGRDLAFHRGVNALDDERADMARRHFAEHLEAHPGDSEAWRLAGDAWMSGTMRSPGEATERWRRYLELRPDDQKVLARLVDTLLLDGDWQAAESWSAQLDDSQASRMVRGKLLLETDPIAAGQILESALADEPDHPGLDALAAQFHYLEGDPERAVAHAKRAVAANPFDLQSLYLLTRLLRRRGDAAGADELLVTHDLVSRAKGAAGASKPTPSEALVLVEELASRVPTDGLEFQLEWLRVWVANGNRGEAKRRLGEIAVRPDLTAPVRMEVAGLADQVGDLAVARQLLQDVFDQAPVGSANRRRALFGLSLLAYRERDEKLEALVEEGLAAFPHAAGFWHLRGRMALNRDDPEAAARDIQKAVLLGPWRTDFRIDLANIWLSQGQLDEVLTLLAEAPDGDPAVAAYRRQHGLDDVE